MKADMEGDTDMCKEMTCRGKENCCCNCCLEKGNAFDICMICI